MDQYEKIHGDDDGGLYFKDRFGGIWYLHGYPKLVGEIIALCEVFFKKERHRLKKHAHNLRKARTK